MIIYSSSALEFREKVDSNLLTISIEEAFIKKMGMRPSRGEIRAWNNSMQFMERVIRNSRIADDCGIMIEYNIPATSKRVDFIVTGRITSYNVCYTKLLRLLPTIGPSSTSTAYCFLNLLNPYIFHDHPFLSCDSTTILVQLTNWT